MNEGRPAGHPYPEQFDEAMDLPPFEGRPRTYLIATTPRCGSHLLGHALATTGHFGVPLEYLNGMNVKAWRRRFGVKNDRAVFAAIVRHRTSASGWFGVKAHWSQFAKRRDRFPAPLGPICKTLFIYRRDLLGQAVSFLRAQQTGQWISGAPARGEARFDYDGIVDCAASVRRQNARWNAFFAELEAVPVQRVVYEDLIDMPAQTLETVARFLDPDCPVVPSVSDRTQRQSDGLSGDWRKHFLARMQPDHDWILASQRW